MRRRDEQLSGAFERATSWFTYAIVFGRCERHVLEARRAFYAQRRNMQSAFGGVAWARRDIVERCITAVGGDAGVQLGGRSTRSARGTRAAVGRQNARRSVAAAGAQMN